MNMTLRVGARPSRLALKQVEEIRGLVPQVPFEIVPCCTTGDRDKVTSLRDAPDDFFTRELDQALLNGRIDAAVHSSKDLPQRLPRGLVVGCETPSAGPHDALVSAGTTPLSRLAPGSKVGVSSVRRADAVLRLRPDLALVDVRGTIEERVGLIHAGRIDALIVAEAALRRLGLGQLIAEVFLGEDFPVHPKQGCLSVVVRECACERVAFFLSALDRAIRNLSASRASNASGKRM